MTLSEIEKVLEKRAVVAVNHATELIMKDMSEVIADYYGDYPNPKRYNRTGLLKSTPKVFKAPACSGNSATAEIGLNTDLQYHTGTWSMSNVISSAENNLHAPNENMPIDRYIQGIKYAATIFDEFAKRMKEKYNE